MLFFWKKFQRWREEHHLGEETKARETEKPSHPERRDDQRTQTLLLALGELQRAMDPLIAVQVYNHRFCPLISQLPEELLLCICDFLRDDFAALLCLRIASRIFLRLLNSDRIYLWGAKTCSIRGEAFYLHDAPKLRFRQLLQRDGRCNTCKRWTAAHASQLLDDCKFQQTSRRLSLRSRVHCNACDSLHDVFQFPQQPFWYQPKQICLGQQGMVQLCAHVSITWAKVKAHIDDWRQNQSGGDWQACLDSFRIECYDPSHDTRCTVLVAQTWPRARLATSIRNPDIVVLNLEWKPHSRISTLALTADGRIPAPELRALFQKLRSCGPADTLYPRSHPGALPEMAFFCPSSHTSRLVHYNTGDEDAIRHSPASLLSPRLPSALSWNHRHGVGRNGAKLNITLHCPSDAVSTVISSQCLVISYEKDIMICKTTALTDPSDKIIPTDHWLHAMDTDSYPHPQGSSVRPQCKDLDCVNYYRKRRDSYPCSAYHYAYH
ncbi:hypothetical protein M3J07_007667 [Ascochyta lentis]